MALAAADPLVGVVAAPGRLRRLDGLAVENGGGRAGGAAGVLAVEHQREIVEGAEQQPAREAAEPPLHGQPGREVVRQQAPAAAGAGVIADGIDHLAHPTRCRRSRWVGCGSSGAITVHSVSLRTVG